MEIGFLQDAIKLRRGEIILDLGGALNPMTRVFIRERKGRLRHTDTERRQPGRRRRQRLSNTSEAKVAAGSHQTPAWNPFSL